MLSSLCLTEFFLKVTVGLMVSSRHVSSVFSDHSKRPDPPSSPGSLRPASVRRSSTSWTPTCSERTPRAPRACRPTGKTSTSRRRTAPPACQTRRSATTTPSLGWGCPAPPARCRAIPVTTAAGTDVRVCDQEVCEVEKVPEELWKILKEP